MSLRLVAGAVIADRFCLVRPLGKGGMGEVWLARHLALEGFCAVKLIHPQAAASAELSARFVLEAKTAAQIRSAHVVQILDAGVCEGTPYIAMEHLEGEDLFARLTQVHVLGSRETAAIVTQVARALTRAHAAGIIHRDLKPGNLFLCRDGDREIVKVLDFGIAKRLGGAPGIKTMPDTVLGTLSYMSPEQAQNTGSVDHRCDLWALGVIAFRCLTGQLPFKSASPLETLNLVLRGPIPVPSQIAPVPPGFDAWWARAASRDPAHRFQTAKEMADALQRALGLPSREGAVTALFAWPVAPSPSAVPSPALAPEEGTPSPALAATVPDTHEARSRRRSCLSPPRRRGAPSRWGLARQRPSWRSAGSPPCTCPPALPCPRGMDRQAPTPVRRPRLSRASPRPRP